MGLPDLSLSMAHMFLFEVYGDFPHHTEGSHLDRSVADDALW